MVQMLEVIKERIKHPGNLPGYFNTFFEIIMKQYFVARLLF